MSNGNRIPPEWVRTIVIIVAQLVALVAWGAILDTKVNGHIRDENVHMPLSAKIETFVPRTEIDGRLKNIEEDLAAIRKALKIP